MCSDKSYLTPKDVAELLMVSVSAIRLWAERGELKAMVTAGGHRRFQLDDIRQFAKERKIHLNIKADTQSKILVVDDEESICFIMKKHLEKGMDCSVDTCGSAEDAMLIFEQNKYDLLFLDLNLPGASGLDILPDVRKLFPEMPVVIITGLIAHEDYDRVLFEGAAYCMLKPIRKQEIFDVVNKLDLLPASANKA